MAALTTVVVAAAATAVAGAVAGAGAASGSGVGVAQVPQQVNRGGPEASLAAGVGLRGCGSRGRDGVPALAEQVSSAARFRRREARR